MKTFPQILYIDAKLFELNKLLVFFFKNRKNAVGARTEYIDYLKATK